MAELGLFDEEQVAPFYKYDTCGRVVKKDEAELFASPEEAALHAHNVIHCFWREGVVDFGFEESDKEIVEGAVGMNFVFAIKHNNGGKLNSHLFFFRGFCGLLDPEYATLLDIGTEVRDGAIDKLLGYMGKHPDCGGACGEVEVDTTVASRHSWPVVYAQYFEYKVSNYLDKMA